MKCLGLFLLLFSHTLLASTITVDGQPYGDIHQAKNAIVQGSRVHFGSGIYTQGLYLSANDLVITGEADTIFDGAVVDEKAALVLVGNNILVERIACRNIKVKDKNGACIRFEGKNLTIRHLDVQDCESGVMTSRNKGFLKIEHSNFERLGTKAKGVGFAHAIYAKVDTFILSNSRIVSTKNEATAIKSRSGSTKLLGNVIASLEGNDSRLIDVANFGELTIEKNILQQGVNSQNSQLIAYGLEPKIKIPTGDNFITIRDNLIVFDKPRRNILLAYRHADSVNIHNNILVGEFAYPTELSKTNLWLKTRKAAKLEPYPLLPSIKNLAQLFNNEH